MFRFRHEDAPETVEADVVGLLEAQDEYHRLAALGSEAVREALEDPSPRVRQAAIRILGELRPRTDEDWRALLAGADDADVGVRRAALAALDASRPDAAHVLLRALTAPDPGLRALAATALGEGRAPSAGTVLALAARSNDRDAFVRVAAIHALGPVAAVSEPAYHAILGASEDPSPAVRSASAVALVACRRSGPEIARVLHRLAEDDDDQVAAVALAAISRRAEEP